MKLFSALVLITLVTAYPPALAGVITPKFWNHYKGLSYLRAIKKKNFNKCEVEMSVNSEGVTIGRYLGDYYFKIHYPPNTITVNQDDIWPDSELAPGEHVYSLHDSETPHITLLKFLETGRGTTKAATIEGHSQTPLALFFQDNDDAESLLHKQYDSVLKIVTRQPDQKTGTQADSQSAHKIRDSMKRLEMLGNAIRARNFKVQLAALTRIHDEYIMPAAVPVITSFIVAAENKRYSQHVLGSAIDLAFILLHEAYVDVRATNQLKLIYGTTDIRRIHDMTKGRASFDKLPLLEFAANMPAPEQTWTAHDIGRLVSALTFVSQKHDAFSFVDASRVKAELQRYSNPFGACAAALSGNTSQLVN